jgi:tetratricopeptide (TPR) repeat protein
MKKIILFLILVMSFTFTFAQKANVRLARDKALNEDKPDFKGAREAIKLALQDSTTKNQAETWYVAGLIGNKQSEAEYKKAILNLKFDTLTKGKALIESYDYFIQAIKFDMLPDAKAKVKPKYAKEIKAIFKDYYTIQPNLIGYGAYQYGKDDFKGAVKTFETFLEIPKLPVMNNEIKMDSTYDMITYYTGVCASSAKMNTKALQYFESLKDKKYQLSSVYQNLANEYLNGKDTVNYIKTIKEGIDKFPKLPWFLQNLINFYIHSNKIQDAISYLNTAIEREPSFAQYQFVKGQLYLSLENFDESTKALNKAAELDPKNPDIYAETGRSYYNKAVKLSLEANKIKDVSLYKKEEAKIDEVFRQAIPSYKKAIELKRDVEYMTPLKQLYYRLQMDAEYADIAKQIKELQK